MAQKKESQLEAWRIVVRGRMPFTKGAQNALHWENWATHFDKIWPDLATGPWPCLFGSRLSRTSPVGCSSTGTQFLVPRGSFHKRVTNKRTTPVYVESGGGKTHNTLCSPCGHLCVLNGSGNVLETSKNWNLPWHCAPLQTRQPAKRVEHCGWGDTQRQARAESRTPCWPWDENLSIFEPIFEPNVWWFMRGEMKQNIWNYIKQCVFQHVLSSSCAHERARLCKLAP